MEGNHRLAWAHFKINARARDTIVLGLVFAVVALVISHIFWASRIAATLDELAEQRRVNRALTAFSMPLDFLVNESECTNKLLNAMGHDSVRVRRGTISQSQPPLAQSQTLLRP